MKPFAQCPVCGGELENKEVEKLLRGGGNTVAMRITAEVCLHCGERYYTEELVKSFCEMQDMLERQEFSHFKHLGQSFTVGDTWSVKSISPAAA